MHVERGFVVSNDFVEIVERDSTQQSSGECRLIEIQLMDGKEDAWIVFDHVGGIMCAYARTFV